MPLADLAESVGGRSLASRCSGLFAARTRGGRCVDRDPAARRHHDSRFHSSSGGSRLHESALRHPFRVAERDPRPMPVGSQSARILPHRHRSARPTGTGRSGLDRPVVPRSRQRFSGDRAVRWPHRQCFLLRLAARRRLAKSAAHISVLGDPSDLGRMAAGDLRSRRSAPHQSPVVAVGRASPVRRYTGAHRRRNHCNRGGTVHHPFLHWMDRFYQRFSSRPGTASEAGRRQLSHHLEHCRTRDPECQVSESGDCGPKPRAFRRQQGSIVPGTDSPAAARGKHDLHFFFAATEGSIPAGCRRPIGSLEQ